jgi:hypothetical protein
MTPVLGCAAADADHPTVLDQQAVDRGVREDRNAAVLEGAVEEGIGEDSAGGPAPRVEDAAAAVPGFQAEVGVEVGAVERHAGVKEAGDQAASLLGKDVDRLAIVQFHTHTEGVVVVEIGVVIIADGGCYAALRPPA